MRCAGCGTQNPAQASFCMACGRALEATRASSVDGGARDGTPVETTAVRDTTAGERRLVTVLFADVVGSTGIAQRIGMESWTDLMSDALERFAPVIADYGGTIAQVQGDGLLALFGAPVAHEDDPLRAVRAGLRLVEIARSFGLEEVEPRHGVEFAVRVGVNTGMVVAGVLGADTHRAYTAMGDAVHLAARLQAEAAPMTVVISESTRRLVEPDVEVVDRGPVELRGWSEPAPIHEVVRADVVPAHGRGASVAARGMVGRTSELTTLLGLSGSIAAGGGQVATIHGDAGIGKSRLVAAWREAASSGQEVTWFEAHSVSHGEGLTYHLVADLIRSTLDLDPAAAPSEQRTALLDRCREILRDDAETTAAYLGHLMALPRSGGDGGWLDDLEPRALRTGYTASIRRLLEGVAVSRPLVIVMEDVHWADPSSAALLARLMPHLADLPVLLSMTTRPDPEAAGWTLVTTAREDPSLRLVELNLARLSQPDAWRLVAELSDPSVPAEVLEEVVLRRAEGNPFFIEELSRALSEVAETEASTPMAPGDAVKGAIPETLHGLLVSRIDRLEVEARQTLRIASVIGRRFALSTLAAAAHPDRSGPEELADAGLGSTLDVLVSAGLVERTGTAPEPVYRFRHALIHDAVYSTLLRRDRRQLHRRVGEAHERLGADRLDEVAGILASHFEAAGEVERALEYFRRAAAHAQRLSAIEEAASLLRRAVSLIGELSESEDRDALEIELQTALGVPLVALEGYGGRGVIEAYRRAQELCARLGRPVAPPILRGLAIGVLTHGGFDETETYGRQLLDAARSEGDRLLEVEGHYVLGVTSFWRGAFAAARQHLEAALDRYDPTTSREHLSLYAQDPKVVCSVRLAYTLWFLGDVRGSRRLESEALAWAEEVDDPTTWAYALNYTGWLANELGDHEELRGSAARLVEVADEHQMGFFAPSGLILSGWAATSDGASDQGIARIREGLGRYEANGQILHTTYGLRLLADAYLAAGDADAAVRTVEDALERTEHFGQWYLEAELRRLLGRALADRGDAEAARRALDTAIAVARDQGALALELRAATTRAKWLLGLDVAAGQEALAALAAIRQRFEDDADAADLRSADTVLSQHGPSASINARRAGA